ncbi:hypothetical protein MRB53_013770 [Persea americana]|uniref:Uncharacterized protein n=1 Tax=Persea americana TaxID=3435 RepID=A0ACC2K8Z7_PERAE|nr:hypothetical protein MRB53_013770 [Persea americana]
MGLSSDAMLTDSEPKEKRKAFETDSFDPNALNPPCLFVMEVRMARDVAEGIPSVAMPDSMERMGNFPGRFLEGSKVAVPREGECRLRKRLESEP